MNGLDAALLVKDPCCGGTLGLKEHGVERTSKLS
jgi:hypothetical protein